MIELPGQGNYNVANTLLDAFCKYRHYLGLPASVFYICPIDGVDFFATNPVAKKKMKAQGFYFLGKQASLDFAELSMLNSSPPFHKLSYRRMVYLEEPQTEIHGSMVRSSSRRLEEPGGLAFAVRRMALNHNLKAFRGRQPESDSSKLKELLSNAMIDPDILTRKPSKDPIAFKMKKTCWSIDSDPMMKSIRR